MISIIISSVNNEHLQQVSKSIKATIGVPYEIIAVENSKGKKGICQVYNQSAAKAQYELLCFIHEDIIIHTQNWGAKLLSLFEADPQLGLIGVAGSGYKPLSPSAWGGEGISTSYINIIQSYKFIKKESTHIYQNPNDEKLLSAACIDGVWLTTTKSIVAEIMFDENTFKGFHCYDIDFSLAVGKKYKVAVTFELLINHFSEGRYDKKWMTENLKLYNKWNRSLPYNVANLTPAQIFHVEKYTFRHFIDELIKFGFPISTAFKMLWKNSSFLTLDPKLFFKIKYYIIKKYWLVNRSKKTIAS